MNSDPLSIFISYASYDNQSENPEERWLNRLLQFLKPLELEKRISAWADNQLTAGSNWQSEIKTAIEKADVAVLLVSPAFLASDFIRTNELPRLLDKFNSALKPAESDTDAEGMLILPILLRPCLIDLATFEIRYGPSESKIGRLSDFQYVPKGMAMNGLSQYEQDKQLEFIARSIDDSRERQMTSTSLPDKDEEKLDKLLQQFLKQYSKWSFNSVRIKNWGGQQRGFEKLASFSSGQIRQRLEELASAKSIIVTDGKKSKVYKWKGKTAQ